MHQLAVKWNEKRGITDEIAKKMSASGKLPENRPCDWCGKKVESGWIHDDCADKERSFWLDILY